MEEPEDRWAVGQTDRETAGQRTNRWTDKNIGGLVVTSISSITSSRHIRHMYNISACIVSFGSIRDIGTKPALE